MSDSRLKRRRAVGSNQHRRKPKITPNGQLGAIAFILIIFYYTLVLIGQGVRITEKLVSRWAAETFIFTADAPIKLQSPIWTAHAQEITPTPTKEPKPDPEDFARHIRQLESSNGENDNPYALHNICKAQGLSNEYGYGGMQLMICFDTPAEATARIERWYTEHRATRTEAQTYCFYNTGNRVDDCGYWERAQGI